MPPEHEALLILTRLQFPELAQVPCEIEAIVKGGSDRRFFRLTWHGTAHAPMVLMVYTRERPDNLKFVPATHRLAANGVHVPHLFAHDEERLCVWMEDLGCTDLHSLHLHSWAERRPAYESTLTQAAKIHAIAEDSLSSGDLLTLEPDFNEGLYLWEQQYFLDHFIAGHCGLDTQSPQFDAAHETLRKLRTSLAKERRCLVHRDFQSQNVILKDSTAWLVDYQGLRLGLAEYDLASLLFDPYVQISDTEQEEMLQYYAELSGRPLIDIERLFYPCAAQRLMQALGAYANLSRNAGKPQFKQHIPAALANLNRVIQADNSLSALASLIAV
jgi:N-acetylmuramate 1-kinase